MNEAEQVEDTLLLVLSFRHLLLFLLAFSKRVMKGLSARILPLSLNRPVREEREKRKRRRKEDREDQTESPRCFLESGTSEKTKRERMQETRHRRERRPGRSGGLINFTCELKEGRK